MSQLVKIDTKWIGGMAFESKIGDHIIRIDGAPEVGGKNSGAGPKPLMLTALAGCTGMDVVSMLKKMRVEYEALTISVEADMKEDFPKNYEAMKVIYTFKGKKEIYDKVKKAVDLSKENYCGVSALYAKAIPLTFEIIIEE